MFTGKLLHLINKCSKLARNAINMKKEQLFHIPITSWEKNRKQQTKKTNKKLRIDSVTEVKYLFVKILRQHSKESN